MKRHDIWQEEEDPDAGIQIDGTYDPGDDPTPTEQFVDLLRNAKGITSRQLTDEEIDEGGYDDLPDHFNITITTKPTEEADMTDNQAAKITANRTAIRPLQEIMAIAARPALSHQLRVDEMFTVATQGIVDIYKELNELAKPCAHSRFFGIGTAETTGKLLVWCKTCGAWTIAGEEKWMEPGTFTEQPPKDA